MMYRFARTPSDGEIGPGGEVSMKFAVALACSIASIVASSAQADAKNIQFHIQNRSGHLLQVRFVSKSRKAWWPGDHSGYNQANGSHANYNLSCNPGELICYAAWSMPDEKLNWGVGIDGTRYCSACCNTCGANASANLDP
jgi:hypothetical protein